MVELKTSHCFMIVGLVMLSGLSTTAAEDAAGAPPYTNEDSPEPMTIYPVQEGTPEWPSLK